jgi:RNA polymerase sigma-70 factor (ECF subfamily)
MLTDPMLTRVLWSLPTTRPDPPDSSIHLPDEPDVVALVDQALAGDADSFAALYDRFAPFVYRYLYGRLGERTEAEDLTSEVFLKAWRARESFHWQGRPFVAWLYRLAHNVFADHVRRPQRLLTVETRDGADSLADPVADAYAARMADIDELSGAIRELTPDQQEVIRLRFVCGLETDEIGHVMHKREGAIRALQMRALQRLRQVLASIERGEESQIPLQLNQ